VSAVQRARLAAGAEVLAARLRARPEPGAVHCDLLVVGSGYGGAVAAARLAGAKVRDEQDRDHTVWVLERGLERRPGSFPARFGELPGEVRFNSQDGKAPRGNVEGLYDLRLGEDVNVLVGNGLGGGSLINAGVMEQPLPAVFDHGWPHRVNLDEQSLRAGYERAAKMLQPQRLPESPAQPPPRKLSVLRGLAWGSFGAAAEAQDLRCAATVNHDGKPSAAGVEMAACTRCGDCVSGCNQGAKGSLDTSYLAWAKRAGAELFCGGRVERLERSKGFWIVHWRHTAGTLAPPPPLHARRVVLAAGSLGSTEILLRSRSDALRFSKRLGERFSTNGDQIAAIFRHDPPAHAARDEDDDPAPAPGSEAQRRLNIGPTICGLVRAKTPAGAIAVEEFAVPAPLKRVLGEVVTTFGLLHQAVASGGALRRHAADEARGHDRLAVSHASLEYSSIIGLVGNDGAGGVIGLKLDDVATPWDGGIAITWPNKECTLGRLFGAQIDWLTKAAAATGGTVVPMPSWQMLPAELPLAVADAVATTVHPLGGCAMADAPEGGVVDGCGRVFDAAGGVHDGLAVLDGAIVPTALVINPALTIAALAERAMPALAACWRLTLADLDRLPQGELGPTSASTPRWQKQAARGTDFRIREQMHGWIELAGRRWWAQLEVPAMELEDLGALLPREQRDIDLVALIGKDRRRALLRLYDKPGDLPDDRPDETPDGRNWLAEVELDGSLQLFAPHRPGWLAALCAYLRGAGLVWARYRADAGRAPAPAALKRPLLSRLLAVARALRTLTQWRQLVYTLRVREVRTDQPELARAGLRSGAELNGVKTLALLAKGNPWRQISELALDLRARHDAQPQPLGTLESDLDYFARWRELLGSLIAQRDQPSALADLGAMGLLTLRILLYTQWPLFIPPGDMPQRIRERLPGPREPAAGSGSPHVPAEHGLPGRARLFHYAADEGTTGDRPVLLIHGLSASGSTFVHPSIPGNLVRFLNGKGRDAWVLELRTSSALDPPRCGPHRFEDVASGDIPAAIDKVIVLTAAATGRDAADVKVDVFAHCIGAAMFCLAVLHRDLPDLHQRIGRVVLSQVGPYTTMSPFNRLRGLVAGFLEDYLGLQELDTRADHVFDAKGGQAGDWDRRPRPSGALAMVDALLATFPYPPDDDEAARAKALARRVGRGHDFRRVRHRADGIVGHAMQLGNVGDETLLALDAIFGWVKTGTLAQTIHMAREGVLTHANGDNESVSGARLAARFHFPVLLLHGRRNQIFDWQGSLKSYRALRDAFAHEPGDEPDAGPGQSRTPPDGDRHWGVGRRQQFVLLERYGHQDTVIGRNVHNDVFPYVEAFLADGGLGEPGVPADSRFVCEVPWMGPMLGHARGTAHDFEVKLLVHAGARRAETCGIVFVPVVSAERVVGHRLDCRTERVWIGDAARARGMRITPSRRPPAFPGNAPDGRPVPERNLLREHAHVLRFVFGAQLPLSWPLQYAVLVLYRELQGAENPADDFFAAEPPAPDALQGGKRLSIEAERAVQRLLDKAAEGRYGIDNAVLTIAEPLWKGRDVGTPVPGGELRFAVGSCQFPPAMFDKVVAGYAWSRLRGWLELPEAGKPDRRPQFLLLLGDQVYLDALGNVFEAPGRRAEDRARRAYEANWRLPPLRAVTRQLPIYPMLDDHEIVNDWQPPLPGDGPAPEADAALRAYHQHQAKLAPPRLGRRSWSYRFAPAGVPFFVLDSRTCRQPRDIAQPEEAHILAKEDLKSLLKWLDDHAGAPVKFIAMPAFLLPLERPELQGAEKLRLDGASGYPATQHAILSHIRDRQIRGVVLLGGDAHLSALTTFDIDGGPTVAALVASGLYAPWPFINARPNELLLDGDVRIERHGYPPLTGRSTKRLLSTEPGCALVDVSTQTDGSTTLRVRLLGEPSPGNEDEIPI
jgi:choline dehydrogenase-like flavoprotein